MKHLPGIDLSGLNRTVPPPTLKKVFCQAYHKVGFAYIVNHGISSNMIISVFDASHRFLALPQEVKMAIALGHKHRG